MITGNEPAQARTGWMPTRADIKDMQQTHLEAVATLPTKGLTIRQHFAAMAMQGCLASGFETTMEQHAKSAVEAADALIAALNNSNTKE